MSCLPSVLADDLYCGGNSPQELLQNFKRVLQARYRCHLRLLASKTIISPKTTTVLGWIWSSGTPCANQHSVNTLASCPTPDSVGQMRSFVGAYKVLSRLLPGCSSLLAPLDNVTAGRQSQDAIAWTDELSICCTITLPRTTDQLWIVTDGAVRKPGTLAASTLARSSFSHPPKCLHLDLWTVNPACRPLRSYVVVSFRQAFASPHSCLLVADIKHQSGTYRAWKFYRLTLLVFMFPLVKMRDVRSAPSLVVRKNPWSAPRLYKTY